LKNWVSDASLVLTHLERRFDPFFRPLFDALFQDLLARGTTALINAKRPKEGLKIAEERPTPDEELYLNSIISSFTTQMNDLWKPGGFERGGIDVALLCEHRLQRAHADVHRTELAVPGVVVMLIGHGAMLPES